MMETHSKKDKGKEMKISFSSPHRFVLEQLCHLITSLTLVGVAPPVVWHVVNVSQDTL